MKLNATQLLLLHIKAAGLPQPELEYRFHPVRRFRFDGCWPEDSIAFEVDGGGWVRGRHHRPEGYENDCIKLNLALELGYRVFRFTPAMIESGEAIKQLKRVLQ